MSAITASIRGVVDGSRASMAHWWRRVRATPAPLIASALVVGAGAGLAAVVFRWLVQTATLIFTGTADYAATTGHPANPWVPWLGGAFVILAPAIGGLLYGPLVHRFAREARGHGVPEVMYAVARRGGHIPGRVAVVKALASAITIGSGGSVGREGPIVQIGSALGSTLGRITRMPETQLRTLVACGAAGGIAATFNAPIAGVFFALELILRDFATRSFAAVMLSSIVASVVGRSILGDHPFLALPAFTVGRPSEYLLFAGLGLLAGAVGVLFSKVLYLVEDLCDWAWRGPEWLRPTVGGLLLGLLLFAMPQLYGVGYPVLEASVGGTYTVGFLLLLVLAKMAATSLTIGIGGSGGVFAPSLVIGAAFGAATGEAIGLVIPGLSGDAGTFALVGMAAVFAGATRAPITAGIILFELTGEYSIILPLLLAVIVATGTSRLLSRDTIYTRKLSRRGVDLTAPALPALRGTTVSALMSTPPPSIRGSQDAREAIVRLGESQRRAAPVVGDDGSLIGVLTAADAAQALASDEATASRTAAELSERITVLAADEHVADVLDQVIGAEATDGVPVATDGRLVGWLAPADVLRAVPS
ncbi:chloride channel protein [Leifsonia sp. LS1]|uniref:chloride channel protein n=1 Tax=Leifsonia sp. LS1 TaxID=2828483 RepID=UPI001CFCE4B9|nr:chloride channel protein [Leifsonia sp. LS1]GIT79718.1 chloride channel protein [Leifsonia sp. LS1]